MSWTRRWGVIGSIALAQIGIIVGYQALVSAGPAPASADETVTPPSAVQTAPPPQTSAVSEPIQTSPTAPAASPVPVVLLPQTGTGSAPKSEESPMEMPLSVPHGGIPLPSVLSDQNLIPVGAKDPACPAMPGGASAPPPLPGPLPSVQQPKVNPEPVAVCPWNLSMEIVDGRTHLTAKTGSDVQFRIICEKLELQTPRGSITASGKVMIASDSVEGICDRMTISWHEEAVVLDKVQMKCKLEGNEAELQADQLRLRLSRFVQVVQPSTTCPGGVK